MLRLSKAAIFAVAALIGLGSTTALAGSAENGYNNQKVVYHINNVHDSTGALRNVNNHLNAVGEENIELIVVTHSSGAFSLVDGANGKTDSKGKPYNFTDQVAGLANRGVKFEICGVTLKRLNIDSAKINENADIVPSGVAQVAHLQQEGYLYVKP